MNLVLDEAEEVHMKAKTRKTLGKGHILGDPRPRIQEYGCEVRIEKSEVRIEKSVTKVTVQHQEACLVFSITRLAS